MATIVTTQFLSAFEAAINAGNMALARSKLSGIDVDQQKNGRFFELAAILELQSGQPQAAEPYLLKGVACANASAFCHYLLGSLHLSTGRYELAVSALTTAVSMGANFLECHCNLGMAKISLNDYEGAFPSIDQALKLNGQSVHAWYGLGVIKQGLQDLDEAEKIFLKVLQVAPSFQDARINLGYTYQQLGRKQDALRYMTEALANAVDEKQKEHLSYMVAALSESATPEKAPDQYVQDMFDRYASNFETNLVDRLAYKMPEILMERLSALSSRRWACVLDMGCGTGLYGRQIRPHCDRLLGLDISSKMVDRAADLGIYDELHCAEIVNYLATTASNFDLVAAADVFVYFGALAELFAATHHRMADDGVFCFSVELMKNTPSAQGYTLTSSGRFSHTHDYVVSVAQQAGFTVLSSAEGVGRLEFGQPVATGFYFLQKTPASLG